MDEGGTRMKAGKMFAALAGVLALSAAMLVGGMSGAGAQNYVGDYPTTNSLFSTGDDSGITYTISAVDTAYGPHRVGGHGGNGGIGHGGGPRPMFDTSDTTISNTATYNIDNSHPGQPHTQEVYWYFGTSTTKDRMRNSGPQP